METTRPAQREILNSVSDDQPLELVPKDTTVYEKALKESVQCWSDTLEKCSKQILFIHEHPIMAVELAHLVPNHPIPKTPVNETAVPDTLLLRPNTIPIFTIRHPILQTRSVIKAILGLLLNRSNHDILTTTSWRWTRVLYDYYQSQGITPLVLDADDYMTSEAYVLSLCKRIGFDPGQVQFSWPATPSEETDKWHPVLAAVQSTLIGSNGLIAGRAAKNMDLEGERARWKQEFEGRDLEVLEKVYEDAMTHWEYLYPRRYVPEV